jgi:NAD(P)-dependent dehydrogenase (short-subunit alcohol dehydrogenase family)
MQNKKNVILISGTSSGIGFEIANLFLKNKNVVVGISRKNRIVHKNYHHLKIDLSKRENDIIIKKFFDKKKFRLTGIVHYDIVMRTNLESVFFITQILIKYLKKNSSIVNISSFSSISGGPFSSHYAISKSGLETLTKNLAIFFRGKQVRVNAISPGLIKTKLAKGYKNHPYFNRVILNRVGKTIEIAEVVKFLISDKSSYINGQIINVDGGMFFR